MTTHDAAIEYIARGWSVLPILPGQKRPATEHGKDDACSDREVVDEWFRADGTNVGIHASRSGIVIVDIDPRNGGIEQFESLSTELGELPPSPTANTGGGGVHHLFKEPVFDELRYEMRAKLRKGVDLIRGNNYIVAPPSVHPSGGTYSWRPGMSPADVELPVLPSAWLELALRERPQPTIDVQRVRTFTGDSVYDVLGQLNQKYVLECVSGTWLVDGEVFTFKRNANGKYNLIVDGKERGNFIDVDGKIGAPDTGKKDGGPLASTWLRYYGHDDKKIRGGLIEFVPDLLRFAESSKKQTLEYRGPDGIPHAAAGPNDVDTFADRDREPVAPPWATLGSFVDEIEAHKNDPWVALRLADEEIVRVLAGGIVVLPGGPGSGKTTLAANLCWQHAAEIGPAIVLSAELPGIEFAARNIGIRCDASWVEVLTGKISVEEMRRVTALERYVVLERDAATLANLRRCAIAMMKQFPGQPALVVVDYVQIIEAENADRGREERLRVSDVIKALDKLARQLGLVIIALSQMSTQNARLARSGDALGNDAGDMPAETSAFNRYASVALLIGKKSDPFEDGSRTVEFSIGKWRMGDGDRVLTLREWGRSGRWRVDGPSKTSTEVREGRDVEKKAKRARADAAAIVGLLATSDLPLSKNAIWELVGGKKKRIHALVDEQHRAGAIVQVAARAPRAKRDDWQFWTADRAATAGMRVIEVLYDEA